MIIIVASHHQRFPDVCCRIDRIPYVEYQESIDGQSDRELVVDDLMVFDDPGNSRHAAMDRRKTQWIEGKGEESIRSALKRKKRS